MKARFRLGKLVATEGALDAAPSREALLDLVQRRLKGIGAIKMPMTAERMKSLSNGAG